MAPAGSAGRTENQGSPQVATWFAATRFAVVLGAFVLAAFIGVALGAHSFFTRDFSNFGYPLAYHVQQSYRAAEIPLWNPYNLAGIPFLAQWNTLCLYPGSLIYILLPLPWSLNLFNLLHLYLGGLGMFHLARRWVNHGAAAGVAGAGYAFGGLMVSSLMWPNNVAALGWLPVVLLTGERAAREGGARCVTAAFVMALQFLTGAPEITALTWAGVAAAVVFGQEQGACPAGIRVRRLTIVVVATLGLAAIQLLPFLELLRHSQRGPQFSTGEWTLTWPGLGNFEVPLFRTFRDRDGIFFQHSQQWVTSYYCGLTILFLALAAHAEWRDRRVRLLTAIALLSVVLALGPHGFVYDWLRRIIPGVGLMRYPIKFIVPITVVLPLLAAYGTRAWIEGRLSRRRVVGLALALAVMATGLTLFSSWRPAQGEAAEQTRRSAVAAVACLASLACLLGAARRFARVSNSWLMPPAIVAVILGDLAIANRHINPVVDPQILTGNVAVLEPRPVPGANRAMVTDAAHRALDATIFSSAEAAAQIPRQALLLNANLIERVPKLDGFFSLYPPETAALTAHLAGRASDPAVQGLLDFLGVSHFNHSDKPWTWTSRTNWLPILNLVPRALPLDTAQKFQPLVSMDFNPSESVYLPPDVARQVRADGSGRGKIVSRRMTHHSIEAIVETDKPMLLSVAQADYPGWRATVDGKRVPLWTANHAFQALEVPAGRHAVKVYFRSGSFETGGLITAISLVACFTAWFRSRSARPRGSFGAQADQAADTKPSRPVR